MNLKKIIVVSIILVIIVLSATACNKNVESTNLTTIKVDDIKLGEAMTVIDFNKYTESDRFEEKENTYNFEEIKIGINENEEINQIHANISEVNLYINSIQEFNNIKDITKVLGENYKNSSYDKEQKLKVNEYKDSENKIIAKFVYDVSEKLVWIILDKY